jgi:hypothetical protein
VAAYASASKMGRKDAGNGSRFMLIFGSPAIEIGPVDSNLFLRNEKRFYPSVDGHVHFSVMDSRNRCFPERHIADTSPRRPGMGVTAHHRASTNINFVTDPERSNIIFCFIGTFHAAGENQQHAEDQQNHHSALGMMPIFHEITSYACSSYELNLQDSSLSTAQLFCHPDSQKRITHRNIVPSAQENERPCKGGARPERIAEVN